MSAAVSEKVYLTTTGLYYQATQPRFDVDGLHGKLTLHFFNGKNEIHSEEVDVSKIEIIASETFTVEGVAGGHKVAGSIVFSSTDFNKNSYRVSQRQMELAQQVALTKFINTRAFSVHPK